jgi:fucose 4-O-acetylase-like acetyltransferase
MKQRIGYIDLAKGICILLVMLWHVGGPLLRTDASRILLSFLVPLYFFLSGMFFNRYSGLRDFMVRKINKLLIPLFFFMIVTYLISIAGWLAKRNYDLILQLPRNIVMELWGDHVYLNFPLWFFFSLFETSVMFYLLFLFCNALTQNENARRAILTVVCFSIGIAGHQLGVHQVNTPFWLGTSMAALPFYYSGYVMRKETNYMLPNSRDKYIPFFLIGFGLLVYFTGDSKMMIINTGYGQYVSFYVSAMSGTMFVLLLSKLLNELPVISFFGVNTVTALSVHWVILYYLKQALFFVSSGWMLFFVLFVLMVLLTIPMILFFRKFFPQFIGQEDLFKVG